MKFKCIKTILIRLLAVLLLFLQGFYIQAPAYYPGYKPLFIEISTQWCFACKIVKPIIEELQREYSDKVDFVLLDLTNEETTKEAEQIASEYGITDLFNSHRNAFPTIIIVPTNTKEPQVLLGARGKETYTGILNNFLGETTIANNPNRPEEPKTIEISGGRPTEPQSAEIPNDRPKEPNWTERPIEIASSGRPPEITFWALGQQIPISAYYQYLVLPECSGSNSTICSNGIGIRKPNNNSNNQTAPIFKPWTPNATRDEKGLHF